MAKEASVSAFRNMVKTMVELAEEGCEVRLRRSRSPAEMERCIAEGRENLGKVDLLMSKAREGYSVQYSCIQESIRISTFHIGERSNADRIDTSTIQALGDIHVRASLALDAALSGHIAYAFRPIDTQSREGKDYVEKCKVALARTEKRFGNAPPSTSGPDSGNDLEA